MTAIDVRAHALPVNQFRTAQTEIIGSSAENQFDYILPTEELSALLVVAMSVLISVKKFEMKSNQAAKILLISIEAMT